MYKYYCIVLCFFTFDCSSEILYSSDRIDFNESTWKEYVLKKEISPECSYSRIPCKDGFYNVALYKYFNYKDSFGAVKTVVFSERVPDGLAIKFIDILSESCIIHNKSLSFDVTSKPPLDCNSLHDFIIYVDYDLGRKKPKKVIRIFLEKIGSESLSVIDIELDKNRASKTDRYFIY